MSEKTILEQALLQVQTLEEAVKANAKGILASTMKQELNDLLKESKEEEEEEVSVEEQPLSDEETADDVPAETGDDEGLDNEDSDEDTSDDEPAKDIDSLDSDETDSDDMDNMDDFGSDFSDEDDEDVVDMTGADEDEVLKVFKAMSPEDGIIVKKDGDDVEFSDGDDEYIIKLDEEESTEEEVSEDWNEETNEEDTNEEVVYEIELDETDESDQMEEYTTEEETNEEDDTHEEEVGESSRTQGFGYHGGIKSKGTFKAGNKREEINEEVSKLKKQNDEYKKALVLFKEKLNEVAVFNANLAYATRLFTEHSTTKQEKLNILKRFDSISTLKESKNLYSSLKTELETKKPVTESVVEKITTAPTTSSSEKVLSESKAYENPQFKRMKDLMSKLK